MSTTNNEEIRSLGFYHPSEFWYEKIQSEIRSFLPPCCQRERISVRVPPVQERDLHYDNMQWHQDGGGRLGTTRHMVLWADRDPTWLKTSDGIVVRPEPFEVVWIDNDSVFHRMPDDTSLDRWFVSVRCSGAMSA